MPNKLWIEEHCGFWRVTFGDAKMQGNGYGVDLEQAALTAFWNWREFSNLQALRQCLV